jgi:hypothetical protein
MFREITTQIKMYDLHPKVTIDLFNAAPGKTLQPPVHGGTMLANIDFIEASTKPSHVNFLSCDCQLTPVQDLCMAKDIILPCKVATRGATIIQIRCG